MSNSVAVVVLDSVRRDYFEEYFDWLPGIRFTNAWSTGNYSIPAHGSLFAGKYPSELGVHAKSQSLDCPDPVLAEQFNSAGYTTRAYSANALVGPDLGYDRGFDEFNLRWDLSGSFPELFSWREALLEDDGPLKYPRAALTCLLDRDSRTIPSLRRAIEVQRYEDEGAAEALSFLRDMEFGDREFLFVNLMEAHWPYWGEAGFLTYGTNPLDEVATTVPGGDVDLSEHEIGYEEWVAYLAEQYKAIYDELRQAFDYVITLSDHGELFGEHGAKAHYYGLFEDLVQIPLVISDGSGTQEIREDVASLVDVHATVGALGDLDPIGRGVDLLAERQDEPRLVEFHGFREHRLESLRSNGFSDEEIAQYDQYKAGIVMGNYYGYETVDGFEERGTPPEDPRAALRELRESMDVRAVGGKDLPLSAGTREHLKHLGYME